MKDWFSPVCNGIAYDERSNGIHNYAPPNIGVEQSLVYVNAMHTQGIVNPV